MQQSLSIVLMRHLMPIFDMVKYTILHCPEDAFAGDEPLAREHLYHALVGMDIWLSTDPQTYAFQQISELEAAQMHKLASENISRRYLLAYTGQIEEKAKALPISDEKLLEIRHVYEHEITYLDQCLLQIRHVQHHLGEIDDIMRRFKYPLLKWKGYGPAS